MNKIKILALLSTLLDLINSIVVKKIKVIFRPIINTFVCVQLPIALKLC